MSNHAIENARAWYANIKEMVAAHEAACAKSEADDVASGTRYEHKAGYDATEETEAAQQVIWESPLSVQVRSGWHTPDLHYGSHQPTEYEILLTYGGPGLRITGALDEGCAPTSATLEWQAWGTPWTPLHMSELADQASEVDATLLRFASHFYFGE